MTIDDLDLTDHSRDLCMCGHESSHHVKGGSCDSCVCQDFELDDDDDFFEDDDYGFEDDDADDDE